MEAFPLEYLPFPACIFTRKGILQKVNLPFAGLLGHGDTEVFRGLPFRELFHPENADQLEDLLTGCVDPECPIDEEISGTLHDLLGNYVRVKVTAHSTAGDEHVYVRCITPSSLSAASPEERYRSRLTDVFLESGDFSSAYERILQLLLDETVMESGAVYSGLEGAKSLEICASVSLYPELESILRGESISEWSAGKKIIFFGRQENNFNVPPVLRSAGVKTAVFLPYDIGAGEKQQVLYVLFSRTKNSFLPAEEEALRVLHGLVRKATERLIREQTLTNSKNLYHSLIRSMPSGLIVRDGKGKIIHFNLAAARLFGWKSDTDLSPSKLLEGIHFFDGEKKQIEPDQLPGLRSLSRGSKIRNEEIQVLLKDGTTLWLSVNSEPLFHAGEDEPYAMVATFKNVSESHRVMAELEDARRGAEDADEAKSRFLANFSHEIRTPLSGIMGMTDILLTGELEPEQRDQLLLMKEAEDSLLDIINKVLDLSKIEAGKIRIKNGVLHLAQTLRRIVTPYTMGKIQPDIEFRVDISDDIPEYLIGDEAHIQLVLANLVENAVKFTEAGAVSLSVRMYGGIERNLVPLLFSVSDTGWGIPREAQDRIFENFQQLDSSFSKEHQGTGLGLSISRQVIEQMGGSIWLESEPGRGSTFFFNLELRKAAESEIADPDLVPAEYDFSGTERPMDILLVEDNILNQEAIGHLLKNRGHRVRTASNGMNALNILSSARFDLVLMDIQMPKMNGIEATHKIRDGEVEGVDPMIPIVALTAYAMAGEVQTILKSGMNGYVSKPVNRSELLNTIEKFADPESVHAAPPTVIGEDSGAVPEALPGLVPGVLTPAGFSSEIEAFPTGDVNFSSFIEDYRSDIDVARRLLELFSHDLPGKITAVRSALERKDRQTLIDNFHSLTNNLSAVRLYSLGQLSREMEKYAVLEDFDALNRNFPPLSLELERSLAEARKYLQIIRGMR